MRKSTVWLKLITLLAGPCLLSVAGCTAQDLGGFIIAGIIALVGVGAAAFIQAVA